MDYHTNYNLNTMLKIFFSILFLCSWYMNSYAQQQKVLNFYAEITDMTPLSYPSTHTLTDFFFEIKNDSAFIYLPYIGQVYSPTFSQDGLSFDEPYRNMDVKRTKKNNGTEMTFSLKHDIVDYKFLLTAYDDNTIRIRMIPSNAQSCDYYGEWKSNYKEQYKK